MIGFFRKTTNTWLQKLASKQLTLQLLLRKYGSEQLEVVLKQIDERTFKYEKMSDKRHYNLLSIELKKARINYYSHLKEMKNPKFKSSKWLNPAFINEL